MFLVERTNLRFPRYDTKTSLSLLKNASKKILDWRFYQLLVYDHRLEDEYFAHTVVDDLEFSTFLSHVRKLGR